MTSILFLLTGSFRNATCFFSKKLPIKIIIYLKDCGILRNESGSTAIEYALIAMIISSIIISGLTIMASSLGGLFDTVSDKFGAIL